MAAKTDSRAELRFDGRVILVTGAANGMGAEHARYLAARGAKVVVNDVGTSTPTGDGSSAAPAEKLVQEILDAGGKAVASTVSIATFEGAQSAVDLATTTWGRLDGILHNAGIARFAPIEALDFCDYKAVMAVSLDAAIYLTKAAWPIMTAQRFGKLLYVTSAGGLIGTSNLTAYAVAKSGMLGLMNVVHLEGRPHNIDVNLLGVSAWTRMTSGTFGEGEAAEMTEAWWRKYMRPELIAPVAAWLLHPDSNVSRTIYNAGGGHVSRTFLAETRGFTALDLTPEMIRDHQHEINDEADYRGLPDVQTSCASMFDDLVLAGAEPPPGAALPINYRPEKDLGSLHSPDIA